MLAFTNNKHNKLVLQEVLQTWRKSGVRCWAIHEELRGVNYFFTVNYVMK